jgi:hypothetical protein
LVFAL